MLRINTDTVVHAVLACRRASETEIQCRLDMDVFCNSEKYPFIEYEWSFHQRNRQLLRFSHLVDGVGKKISKKNDVCGSGRYAVDIWTPRDRHCADDL